MKGGQNLATLKQKKEEEDGWVKPQPCVQCGKVIGGAYANHGEAGWTCSKACMKAQDEKPLYPNHTEEQFFERNRNGKMLALRE